MSLNGFGRLLLWIGVALTAVSLILALTPIQWEIERYLYGVRDEDYPELFWFGIGLPASLIVVAVALVTLRLARNR